MKRKYLHALAALLALLLVGLTPVETRAEMAAVKAEIDLSDQEMTVFVNGWRKYVWPVSTARRGYRTPVGTYRPQRLARMWYSRKYHWSPMPYSVFFHGGYAIHGTTEIRNLGRPASHGCVRLHPDNAKRLFDLIREHGRENVSIVVQP